MKQEREIQFDCFKTFFSNLSQNMLEKAQKEFFNFNKHNDLLEIDFVYRYYHDSFKIFGLQSSIRSLLGILLIFAGQKNDGADIKNLQKFNLNKNFLQLLKDALSIKHHGGPMKKGEWQKLTSAYFNTKKVVLATIKTVEDFLNGDIFTSPLASHTALFLSIWNFESIVRYSPIPFEEKCLKILQQSGSADVKKAVGIYLRKESESERKGYGVMF